MENIFKNAYLGKAYKTRDGHKAVFYNHHNSYVRERANYVTMILEDHESIYRWYYDGTAADYQEHLDIISEWEDETNEEELDKMAIEECDKILKDEIFSYNGAECVVLSDAEKCWKLGYCQGIKK